MIVFTRVIVVNIRTEESGLYGHQGDSHALMSVLVKQALRKKGRVICFIADVNTTESRHFLRKNDVLFLNCNYWYNKFILEKSHNHLSKFVMFHYLLRIKGTSDFRKKYIAFLSGSTDETARNKQMTNVYIVYIVYIFSTVHNALRYSIKVQVGITKDGVLFYFYQRCNIIIVFTKP